VVAVASRSAERARQFASDHAIPVAYGSLEDLVADPAVDVVYIASPHSEHHGQALLALRAGKHVLVEKPLALSLVQCTEMVRAARDGGSFLMEALWSRFLPSYARLRELLEGGALGSVLSVESSLGFLAPFDPTHRIYRKDLGGGVLLDMGIYPVALAALVLGPPTSVSAAATLGPTGVDHDTVVDLGYDDGRWARAHSSLLADLPGISRITGERGWVELPAPVYAPEALTLNGRVHELPVGGDGLRYQAVEVQRCLAAGLQESPVMSWTDSLSLAATLDEARRQIGLVYP
jgi:predicted dehydrogenase